MMEESTSGKSHRKTMVLLASQRKKVGLPPRGVDNFRCKRFSIFPKCKPMVPILLLFLICSLLHYVQSFNLEPRLPIVKRGASSTLFGFSVAQHVKTAGAGGGNLMLVGAPLSDMNLQDARQTGAIYQCPYTVEEQDCRMMPVRASGDEGLTGGFVTNASNAWLGISLTSQGPGKSVLACAHLYKKSKVLFDNSTIVLIQGVCYSFNNALEYKKSWDGCNGMPWEDAQKSPHELYGQCLQGVGSYADMQSNELLIGAPAALNYKGVIAHQWIERKFGQNTKWRISSMKNAPAIPPLSAESSNDDTLGLDTYLGMSTIIGRFNADPNETVNVAGAPRSRLTGEVFAFTIASGAGGRSVISSSSSSSSSSDLVFYGRLRQGSVGAQFGYSLAKADVNGDGLDDLFVGAPNYYAAARGVVAASQHQQHDSSSMRRYYGAFYAYYNVRGVGLQFNAETPPPAVFYGKSHEGRFGFALSSAGDLNNDGYGDLAVGAPYEDEGSGAVYIFQGSVEGLQAEPSQIIRASENLPLRRPPLMAFGAALSGGVDMDNNGYPDLLVGAYASDAVVVLLARPVVKIFTEVRQLPQRGVNASSEPCRGFTRVCFSFQVCHDLQAVRQQSGGAAQVHARYRIEGDVLKALPGTKRIAFLSPTPGGQSSSSSEPPLPPYIIERTILLSTAPRSSSSFDPFTCTSETVFVDEHANDTLNPLIFRLTSELVEKLKPEYPLRAPPRMDDFPIFDRISASKTFQVNFTNECGEDSVCESDLFIERAELENLPLDDEKSSAMEESGGNRYLLVGGAVEKVNLTLHIVNRGELAYQAKLIVEHPSMLPFVRFYAPAGLTCAVIERPSSSSPNNNAGPTTDGSGGDNNEYGQQQQYLENGDEISSSSSTNAELAGGSNGRTRAIECELGNPLVTGKPVNIILEFETRNIQPLDNEIELTARTDTISQKREPQQPQPLSVVARVVVHADAILWGRDPQGQVVYDGIARGASELLMLSDIGSPVVHEYELYNEGPSALPSSRLSILWPMEMTPDVRPFSGDNNINNKEFYKHNKWLLYLSAEPMFDHSAGVSCTFPQNVINPLNLGGTEKLKQPITTVSTPTRRTEAARSRTNNNDDNNSRTKRAVNLNMTDAELQKADDTRESTAAVHSAQQSAPYVGDDDDLSNNKRIVTFDCDRLKNARCILIECTIPSMERGATTVVRIISRLWKHTFLQDYRNVDFVRIISSARLTIESVYRIQQRDLKNDEARAVTRAIPSASITADEVKKVAPWVVPLAVALGLLLLVCMILALWKCGFFSRRRYTSSNSSGSNGNGSNLPPGGTIVDDSAFEVSPAYIAPGQGVGSAAVYRKKDYYAVNAADHNDDNELNVMTTPHHTTDIMLPVMPVRPSARQVGPTTMMTTRKVGGDLSDDYDDEEEEPITTVEEINPARRVVDLRGEKPALAPRPVIAKKPKTLYAEEKAGGGGGGGSDARS